MGQKVGIKKYTGNKKLRFVYTFVCVLISGFMQAVIIQVFMKPLNLLPSGFMGVALLLEKISHSFFGISFSAAFGLVALNLPVAILCGRSISRRFTLFSMLDIGFASLFLRLLKFDAIFDDVLLNIIFGGFLYGIMTVIALKGNASTGGTDFIALYVSNKKGKSIWSHVFAFNAVLLLVFGYIFGWEYAGYSILFQFVATKTISSFYHRYERVTLQITTAIPEKVITAYISEYRHGVSRLDGVGGYSNKKISLLHTVVSGYEVQDIVKLIHEADCNAIINTFKTEDFYGNFYIRPIE